MPAIFDPAQTAATDPATQVANANARARQLRSVSLDLALEAHAQAYRVARQAQDKGLTCEALFWRADTFRAAQRYTEALADISALEETAVAAKAKTYLGRAWLLRGTVAAAQGLYDAAEDFFARAHGVFLELNDQTRLSYSAANLAGIHLKQGNALQAVRLLADTCEHLAKADELRPLAAGLVNLALELPDLHQPRLAFKLANKALAIALRHTFPEVEVRAELALAEVYLALDHPEAAAKSLQRAERLAALQQAAEVQLSLDGLKARYYQRTGDPVKALNCLAAHLPEAEQTPGAGGAGLLLLAGQLYLDRNAPALAEAAFAKVVRAADHDPACRALLRDAYRGRAEAADRLGKPNDWQRFRAASDAHTRGNDLFDPAAVQHIRRIAADLWQFISDRYPEYKAVYVLR